MEITNNNFRQPSFGLKFYNGIPFKDTVKYAKNGKLQELDKALNTLLHIDGNGNDILIIHGRSKDGRVYSCFNLGKKTVTNSSSSTKSPEEATYKAILDLAENGKKLKSLIGVRDIKNNLTESDILNRYSRNLQENKL